MKMESREEENERQIKLNDKCMEQRKSSGVVVVGILGAATLKHPRQVHCSPKKKWYGLKDCRSKKGVHSLGFVGSQGRRAYWLQLLSKI